MRSVRFFVLLLAISSPVVAARAESLGPVYKDAERIGEPLYRPQAWPGSGGVAPAVPDGPGRRVNGGPGYVGSDWGLGRPAPTGLGSRPDWGRSGE